MRLLLILLISTILLSCTSKVITEIKYIEVQKAPTPKALNLHVPYFHVVSKKNLPEFLERIEKESNTVFFAITPGDYESLAHNTQEFRRYINECRAANEYYEKLLSAGQEDSDK